MIRKIHKQLRKFTLVRGLLYWKELGKYSLCGTGTTVVTFSEMSLMSSFLSLNKSCCISGRGHFQVNTVKQKV